MRITSTSWSQGTIPRSKYDKHDRAAADTTPPVFASRSCCIWPQTRRDLGTTMFPKCHTRMYVCIHAQLRAGRGRAIRSTSISWSQIYCRVTSTIRANARRLTPRHWLRRAQIQQMTTNTPHYRNNAVPSRATRISQRR
ncbi:unnamed protein product [Ectocarpus sp. 12 AP-2014]